MKKEADLAHFRDLFANVSSQSLLKELISQLHQHKNLELDHLLKIFHEVKQEKNIPLSIFSHQLNPAEALCKFLKENEDLSNQEIATLLNRNHKSVWSTYQRAKQRMRKKFPLKNVLYHVPLSIFNNRNYSFLESVVQYLNQTHKLSNKKMAALLGTSPNSIAVLAKRAREKSEA